MDLLQVPNDPETDAGGESFLGMCPSLASKSDAVDRLANIWSFVCVQTMW